jgi:hypothetical protein
MNVLDSPPQAVYFEILSGQNAESSPFKDFNLAMSKSLENK